MNKLRGKIEKTLSDKVNPILAEHNGGAVLVSLEAGVAVIKLVGACAACPSAQITMEEIVKEIVINECKEIKDVILDTSVSEDLIDMARKILNKEIR